MDCNRVPYSNDTQWVSVNNSLRYREKNGIVYVWIVCPQTSGEADTTIGELPDEYKPYTPLYENFFYRPSIDMSASVYVPDTGSIVAVTNKTSGAVIYGIVSYPKK